MDSARSNYHRLLNLWVNGSLRAASRCVRLQRTWYVRDIETGELCKGPSFATKTAAMKWADKNAIAVLDRLKEEATGN